MASEYISKELFTVDNAARVWATTAFCSTCRQRARVNAIHESRVVSNVRRATTRAGARDDERRSSALKGRRLRPRLAASARALLGLPQRRFSRRASDSRSPQRSQGVSSLRVLQLRAQRRQRLRDALAARRVWTTLVSASAATNTRENKKKQAASASRL